MTAGAHPLAWLDEGGLLWVEPASGQRVAFDLRRALERAAPLRGDAARSYAKSRRKWFRRKLAAAGATQDEIASAATAAEEFTLELRQGRPDLDAQLRAQADEAKARSHRTRDNPEEAFSRWLQSEADLQATRGGRPKSDQRDERRGVR